MTISNKDFEKFLLDFYRIYNKTLFYNTYYIYDMNVGPLGRLDFYIQNSGWHRLNKSLVHDYD
jgi:hypothetical protein